MLFAASICIGNIAHAQTSTITTTVNITNTTPDTIRLTSNTGGYSGEAIQVNVVKTSGTMAGNVVLYGSVDNINFTATSDTLVLANVTTNTKVFYKIAPLPQYYYLVATGTGTLTGTVQAAYVRRKYLTTY